MSEVKRYDAVHIRYEESNIRYGEGCEVEMVTASEYDKLAAEKEWLDKLCEAMAVKDGKQFAVMQKLAAELAELKAKMSGVDDRAEFEAAYLKANYPRVHSGELSAPPIFVKTKAGEYDDPDMQRTWIMWQARATLSAPSHGEQVPDGWQLVPIEPTEAMLNACLMGDKYENRLDLLPTIYKAMLAAAPSKEQQ